jgi:hypothetical protein
VITIYTRVTIDGKGFDFYYEREGGGWRCLACYVPTKKKRALARSARPRNKRLPRFMLSYRNIFFTWLRRGPRKIPRKKMSEVPASCKCRTLDSGDWMARAGLVPVENALCRECRKKIEAALDKNLPGLIKKLREIGALE